MSAPSPENLYEVLELAAVAHHNYQTEYLNGKNDDQWPGWYAAYTLGRLGDFITPTLLTRLLETAPMDADWSRSAANHIVHHLI